KGVDSKVLLSRAVDFFSDLHYLALTGESRSSDPDLSGVANELASKLSKDEIIRAVDLGLNIQRQMISAINTAQAVESFIVKLCLNRPAFSSEATGASNTPRSSAGMAQATMARSQAAPAASARAEAPVSRSIPAASMPSRGSASRS